VCVVCCVLVSSRRPRPRLVSSSSSIEARATNIVLLESGPSVPPPLLVRGARSTAGERGRSHTPPHGRACPLPREWACPVPCRWRVQPLATPGAPRIREGSQLRRPTRGGGGRILGNPLTSIRRVHRAAPHWPASAGWCGSGPTYRP